MVKQKAWRLSSGVRRAAVAGVDQTGPDRTRADHQRLTVPGGPTVRQCGDRCDLRSGGVLDGATTDHLRRQGDSLGSERLTNERVRCRKTSSTGSCRVRCLYLGQCQV